MSFDEFLWSKEAQSRLNPVNDDVVFSRANLFAEHRVTNTRRLTASERLECICVISILCIGDEMLQIRHSLHHLLPPEHKQSSLAGLYSITLQRNSLAANGNVEKISCHEGE